MYSQFPLPSSNTNYQITWPYLEREHVVVLKDGIPWPYFWLSDTEIKVNAGPDGELPGVKLEIMRVTPDLESYASIKDATTLTADQFNRLRRQLLYLIQERSGNLASSLGAAINAIANDVGDIGDALDNVDSIVAQLTADLATMNILQSDVVIAKNDAAAAKAAILQEIADTNAEFVTVHEQIAAAQTGNDETGARVTAEIVARQNDTSTLAARIDEARVDFETADAALSASITTVEQARADGDAALAARVTSLEAVVDTEGASVSALINQEAETRANADAASATQITTIQSTLNGDALDSLVSDPEFKDVVAHWTTGDATVLGRADAGVPIGSPSLLVLRWHGTVAGGIIPRLRGADPGVSTGQRIPVSPGEQFDMSLWVTKMTTTTGVQGVDVRIIEHADLADAGVQRILATASDPGTWTQLRAAYVVPASGVSYLRIYIRGTTGNGPWLLARPALYRRVAGVQAAVAQVEEQATTNATRFGTIEANYTLKTVVRSDGKQAVAGIGLAATVNGETGVAQSEVILMGDRFLLTPPDDVSGEATPILVAGTVNGAPTTVFPAARFGDQSIGANVIVDGAIAARHMTIKGGIGSSLWMDPNGQDPGLWTRGSSVYAWPTFATVTDGKVGTSVIRSVSTQTGAMGTIPFPVSAGKRYRISCYARRSSTANGVFYLRMQAYDGVGGTYQLTGGVEAVALTTSWTRYSYEWTPTSDHLTAVPRMLMNHGGSLGYHEAQDIRVEEMLDNALVVQGGITADRINTDGLQIKDGGGNVIFTSGSTLGETILNTGPNLIKNPDFEMDAGGVAAPGGWSRSLSGSPPNAALFKASSYPTYGPPWNRNQGWLYAGVSNTADYVRWYTADAIAIDPAKSYSISCWAREWVSSAKVYLGVICYGTDGIGITNVYTHNAYTGLPQSWVRLSGVLGPGGVPFPAGTVAVRPVWYGQYKQPGSSFATRFCFNEGTTPPTDHAPLNPSVVSDINRVSNANVSTYIAAAAIDLAQINRASIGNLSAITAEIGTLRTATSGGRTEIKDNVIKVYDASNVLRVRFGNLTL